MTAELERLKKIRDEALAKVPAKESPAFIKRIEKLEGHIAERSDPALADAESELIFDGAQLTLRDPKATVSFPAVSGRPTDAGFDFSQGRQQEQDNGPIPEGVYWIDPSELQSMWFRRGSAAGWGSHRVTIHPFHSTNTYGRGGFFIHGGQVAGSAGCIDLTTQIGTFADAIAKVPSKQKVKVTVRY